MFKTSHKNKSIKELIGERISGKSYVRAVQVRKLSKPKLQIVIQEFGRNPLHQEIIENSITLGQPLPDLTRMPTLLQRLSPSQHQRAVAYQEVAQAQTILAQATATINSSAANRDINVKSLFTRTPKAISSLLN